jgi:hypothetical protein
MKKIIFVSIFLLLNNFVLASEGVIDTNNFTSPFLDNQTFLFEQNIPHKIYWNTDNPFSVRVDDGKVSGFIWGDSIGWISLNCQNTNSCSSYPYKVLNDGEGNLSGYAWGENTGWISFSCENVETNNCNSNNNSRVKINPENGEFSGYAWSENFGWILFDCASVNSCVKTTWRKNNQTSSSTNGFLSSFLPLNNKVSNTNNDASCSPYMKEYIKLGEKNNYDEVVKLEKFLNEYQGEKLSVNGIYEIEDFNAVLRFQKKYEDEILSPWSSRKSTGYVYITTLAKINSFFCKLSSKDKIYFTEYHKYGDVGGDVLKIQNFLNSTLGLSIKENGFYGEETVEAVKKFQASFSSDILSWWGINKPTGRWYVSTRVKANNLLGFEEPPIFVTFLKKSF